MVSVTDLIEEYIFPLVGKFKPMKNEPVPSWKENGKKRHRQIEKLLRKIKNGASVEAVLSANSENDDGDEEKLKHILLKKVFQDEAERDVTKKILDIEYYVESDTVNGRIDAVFLFKSTDGTFDRKNVVIYDWKFIRGENPIYLENELRYEKKRNQRFLMKNVKQINYHKMNAVQLNMYRVLYRKQEELGRDVNIKMKLFYITPLFKTFPKDIEIMEEVDKLFENDRFEAVSKYLLYDNAESRKK